jgi:hypothetical protein
MLDYRCCDVCGEKAFYDASLPYDFDKYPDNGLFNLGDWRVICRKCSDTHVLRVVALEQPADTASASSASVVDREEGNG